MSSPEPSADYAAIDRLLDARNLDAARSALAELDERDPQYVVLRIKLALYTHELPPGAAMQKLIQLMRENADYPGAKQLYQQASRMAYEGRESSVAHSHPPPPVGSPSNR